MATLSLVSLGTGCEKLLAKLIAESLPVNERLVSLSLSGNKLAKAQGPLLKYLEEDSEHLKKLDLSNTFITPQQLLTLVQTLFANKVDTLHSLDLSENQVGKGTTRSAIVEKLSTLIKECSCLVHLSLCSMDLQDTCSRLIEALPNSPCLQAMHLSDNEPPQSQVDFAFNFFNQLLGKADHLPEKPTISDLPTLDSEALKTQIKLVNHQVAKLVNNESKRKRAPNK